MLSSTRAQLGLMHFLGRGTKAVHPGHKSNSSYRFTADAVRFQALS